MFYRLSRARRALLTVIILAAIALGSAHGGRASALGGDIGGDFALTDDKGAPFNLGGQRGKVVLLFFGYTSCPDACPATMTKLSSVYKGLGADRDRVLTIFISVDPERDTPEALGKYMRYFGLNAVGLTGKKAEIDAVVKQYGASYAIEKSDSALGYHI